jgi:hypothetical protein
MGLLLMGLFFKVKGDFNEAIFLSQFGAVGLNGLFLAFFFDVFNEMLLG